MIKLACSLFPVLLMVDGLMAQGVETRVRKIPVQGGGGSVESRSWTQPDTSYKQQITWLRSPDQSELVYELNLPKTNSLVSGWALAAAYAEKDTLALVVGNSIGNTEFWRLEKRAEKWETTKAASLPDLLGVFTITFKDLDTFQRLMAPPRNHAGEEKEDAGEELFHRLK